MGGSVLPASLPMPAAGGQAAEQAPLPLVPESNLGGSQRSRDDGPKQMAMHAADGYTMRRKINCEDIQTGFILETVVLTGMSTASCQDAQRFLLEQDQAKENCTPGTREGKKEWIETESCPVP
jgi:hypothetical protein